MLPLLAWPKEPAPSSQSLPSSRLQMEISSGSIRLTTTDPSARFSANPAGTADSTNNVMVVQHQQRAAHPGALNHTASEQRRSQRMSVKHQMDVCARSLAVKFGTSLHRLGSYGGVQHQSTSTGCLTWREARHRRRAAAELPLAAAAWTGAGRLAGCMETPPLKAPRRHKEACNTVVRG